MNNEPSLLDRMMAPKLLRSLNEAFIVEAVEMPILVSTRRGCRRFCRVDVTLDDGWRVWGFSEEGSFTVRAAGARLPEKCRELVLMPECVRPAEAVLREGLRAARAGNDDPAGDREKDNSNAE